MKLIVELDGSGHLNPKTKKKDEERDHELTNLGYHILRFFNYEIDESLEGVLTLILEKCRILSH